MSRRAFTLPELLVALVLAAAVSTAVVRGILLVLRTHRTQAARVRTDAVLRSAVALLERELITLDAGDPSGGDLLEATPTSVTYRLMHGLYVACAVHPAASATVSAIVLRAVVAAGDREIEPARDSVFLYVGTGHRPGSATAWLRADVVRSRTGARCPDGTGGQTVTVAGHGLSLVARGAPVRLFRVRWLGLYRDRRGEWWLGVRDWKATTGWSVTQPAVGPLAPGGLRFAYIGAAGQPAALTQGVRRIEIKLIAAAGRPALARADPEARRSLEIAVALRNNPRP